VPGLFVIGTDTDVGKSVLSAALLAAMAAAGESVSAHKPLLTGTDEPPSGAWPADHELLASVTGEPAELIAPTRFGPAVSPHLAAELAGIAVDPRDLLAAARAALGRAGSGVLVVEGVGGLMVPLDGKNYLVRDLARELGLGLLLAARPGLGTINHTLLTLEAARAADLDVRAVVLTPWPDEPGEIERSNQETIAHLGAIDVHVLERIDSPDPRSLASAGAGLPWRDWIA
jgi:dethiobiotin synthetase